MFVFRRPKIDSFAICLIAPSGRPDNAFQQRGQMVALMGIGGSDVQFLDIAFLIGTGMLFVTESV